MAKPTLDKSSGWWSIRVRTAAGTRVKKMLVRDHRWKSDKSWPKPGEDPKPPYEALVAARPFQDADEAGRKGLAVPGLVKHDLREFLENYQRSQRLSKTAGTVRGLEIAARYFLQFTHKEKIDHVEDVGRKTVREFLEWLADVKRLRYGSVKTMRAHIAAAFNRAVLEDMIAGNPWHQVKPPGRPDSDGTPAYSIEEVETIAKAMKSRWHRDLWWTGTHCGFRKNALLHLRWKDVRWSVPGRKTGLLVCRRELSKSGKEYSVPLSGKLLDTLQERLVATGGGSDDLVFPGKSGGLIGESTWKSALERACERCGIPFRGSAWHCMRATCASIWAAKGINPLTLMRWMGHASLNMTDKYLRYASLNDDAEADKLEPGHQDSG